MKKLYIFFIFLLSSTLIYSQHMTIKGVVKDEGGETLIGVTVKENGTSNGTITAMDGTFIVQMSGVSDSITVSYVGYQTVSLKVNSSQTNFSIVMKENAQLLEEVVVVGYGVQRKVSVTGSISSIRTDEMTSIPTSNITNSLSGNISGLSSIRSSGRPGQDGSSIKIRGVATFNNTNPLVLVDGIERNFSDIDPNDIENLSVLKDASATAVYGVRGANGVILVTTKRGVAQKTKFSFSAEAGITEFIRLPKLVDNYQYALLRNEFATNNGSTPVFTDYDLERYLLKDNQSTHFTGYAPDLFRTGFQQKYYANISGGNERARYFVSIGLFDQGGNYQTNLNKIYDLWYIRDLFEENPGLREKLPIRNYDPDFGYQRINFRGNIDINLTKKSSLTFNLAYITGIIRGPGRSEYYENFIKNATDFAWINANGTFGANGRRQDNPIESINFQGYKKEYTNTLQATVNYRLELDELLKGLSFSAKFSYDNAISSSREYSVGQGLYRYNRFTNTYSLQNNSYSAPEYNTDQSGMHGKTYTEAAVNYKQIFGKHDVAGMVLVNIDSRKQPNKETSMYGNISQIYQGVVGRINYQYDDRYLFEFNMGYNGSNRFAKGHRYALFPAASVGWILTQEKFFKENDILSFLKLRASIGQVGNDALGGFAYYYDSVWGGGAGYNFGVNPTGVNGLKETQIGNDNITWEKSTKYNVGIDTQFFNNKLSFSAEYFMENRTDILRNVTSYYLFSGIQSLSPINVGQIKNKGFDLELGWNQQLRDFKYNVKFITSFARNEIIENGEIPPKYDYQSHKGQSIGQYFGWDALSLFQSWPEIAAAPQHVGSVQPGDVRFRDVNGDGVIDSYDEVPIGYPNNPEVNFSGRFGFSYKGFDFSMLLQGVTNVSMFYPTFMVHEYLYENSPKEMHLGRWTPETASTATFRRLGVGVGTTPLNSSYYIQDGSYIRLKNVELGYTLPSSVSKKMRMQNIRIYLNGFNVYTWSKVKGCDPEGIADEAYPQTRIFNMGLKFDF
ncbi:SusC/RagA family TonB-linked outer membrane protein [Dysgonomonas termitidis]|uniref:SusC/RagA family TonB-linked outer membrane protein n=1 Tax=Dysgonomonas termitidis TaxID=1516126 RepID=A0ABV9L1T5_9BACT